MSDAAVAARPGPRALDAAPIGFRSWSIVINDQKLGASDKYEDGVFLLGPAGLTPPRTAAWRPGVNEARCYQQFGLGLLKGEHRVPAPACQCGLHAYHDFGSAMAQAGMVKGAVFCWGGLEVARNGLRAEYAQIIALAADPTKLAGSIETVPCVSRLVVPTDRARAAARWILKRLASYYRVPLVSLDDLATVAAEYGDTIPATSSP